MKRLLRFFPLVACSLMLAPVHAQTAPSTRQPSASLSLDLLSDTGGANLTPYMRNLVAGLKEHWTPLVEQAVKEPSLEPEETVIRVTIAADGTITSMKLENSTRDASLDRAAWQATTSTHFQPPPAGMRDPDLTIRVHFTVK